MSGGGGKQNTPSGSTTVTNTSNSAPWSVQQPYLQQAFGQAQNLFQNNTPQYFPGATYAQPDTAQESALNSLANAGASLNPLLSGSVENLQTLIGGNILNNDPLTPLMYGLANNPAGASTLNSLSSNNLGVNNAGYGTLNNLSSGNIGANSPGFSTLSDFAGGQGTNPYLASVSNSILSQAIPASQAGFINGGGLSSPEAAYATSQGATAALAPTLSSLFENERNRQLSAAGTLGGMRETAATTLGSQALQGGQLQASAAGTLGSLQNTAASNAATEYQNDIAKQIQALSLVPQTTANYDMPAQQQYAAGAQGQQLDQSAINDAIQRFNYAQTLPYQQLNEYLGQIGGNYGSQGSGSTTTPFFTNSVGSALGGALGGAQLGTSILGSGGLGLLSNGVAAGGGAGLGAMLGIFSDRRVKADIRKVGMLENGLPIYAFRYKGELTPRIGLMADEVEKIHPEAVTVDFLGLKSVDYALAVQ